jgi:opacity protein-like surface antigen
MKYLAISAALLVASFSAQTVRAADDDPYNRPGMYVGVGASRSVNFFDGTLGDAFAPLYVLQPSHAGDTWGANARAGYRINKFLAVEAEYEWMKDFTLRAGGIDFGSLQTQVATANLKVIVPWGQFQPYVLAGAGAIFTTLDKSFPVQWDIANGVFTSRFGAGLDYWVTENMSLNLGGEVVVNNAKVTGPPGLSSGRGLDYFSAQFGVGFRF